MASVVLWGGQCAAQPVRDPAKWPFSEQSPWNVPLPAKPLLQAAQSACSQALIAQDAPMDVNAATWSHPIYLAQPSDPLQTVSVAGKKVATLRIPLGARPAGPDTSDSDAHLHIIDPTRRFVHELWRAAHVPGGWNAQGYSRNDLHGLGVGEGGERAWGGSAIGGLIRTGELTTGIPHALALALPRNKLRPGPVWPAVAQDHGANRNYRGAVPMGQRVTLALSLEKLAALPLDAKSRRLAQALYAFGAYVVDSAHDVSFYAEPQVAPELADVVADLPKLRPFLRCVQASQLPGPLRAAPAAPLAPVP